MKYVIIAIFILCLSATSLFAGSDESSYDKRWEITVINCNGGVTVYNNCALTNQGQWVVSFIPNSGKISTSRGPEIRVIQSTCTEVILKEIL